jgi:hypothetical protein
LIDEQDVIGLHEGVRITDPQGIAPQSVKEVLKSVLEFQLLQHGIMPRGCRHLFDKIVELEAADPNIQYDVRCSYLEIYNEGVYDLLNKADKPLELKLNTSQRQGFYVEGLTELKVDTTDDVMKVFMQGASNRTVS